MMGGGYFTPLTGYMSVADALSIADSMKLENGLFWPVPFMNIVKADQLPSSVKSGQRIALRDPNVDGNPVLAIQEIKAIEKNGEISANLQGVGEISSRRLVNQAGKQMTLENSAFSMALIAPRKRSIS